jgi:hypothetical protein
MTTAVIVQQPKVTAQIVSTGSTPQVVAQPKVTAQLVVDNTTSQIVVTPKTTLELAVTNVTSQTVVTPKTTLQLTLPGTELNGRFTTNLVDTPSTYSGAAGNLVQVNAAGTGLQFTDEIDLTELIFDATNDPLTVSVDTVPMYLTASGVSPSRELTLKIKTQDGDEIIIASFLT